MASIFKWTEEGWTSDLLGPAVQQRLAHWNEDRLEPRLPDPNWIEVLETNQEMLELEAELLEWLRADVSAEAAAAPSDSEAFIAWFEALEMRGPGQHDPLFDWLAEKADADQMRWYLAQEAAGEAGFDDLTALTQVKLPSRIKLELARNYWDEMGRGNPKGMHGPMLGRLVDALNLNPSIETTVTESLALANAMTAMATRRDYAWHALGALGVIELTAPARSAAVAQGLKRLGVPAKVRLYFDLHATLDVKHSAAWNAEALLPAVAEDPRRARGHRRRRADAPQVRRALLRTLPAGAVVTRREALAELLQYLKAGDYEFTAVTPATHARVLSRPAPRPLTVRDIFGWNRLFETGDVGSDILALLHAAELIEERDGWFKSRVRVASIGAELLLHGSYPTDEPGSVFLGPDTYRFVRFLGEHLPRFVNARRLIDMGAGSGAGAIAAARLGTLKRITMVDTNAAALELAAVNARVAGVARGHLAVG